MATTFDEEDDIMLPLWEQPSSPVRPKLKRLKKASERQPIVHLPDIPPGNRTLPPDSSEPLDPFFSDSAGLIHEFRKEILDEVIEDEPLLPDSLEEEHIVEDDNIDPLFPDSGGLIEELRRERLEETKVRGPSLTNLEDESLYSDQDGLNDGFDPLFPKPGEYKALEGEEIGEGGLIEELRQEKSAKRCLNFNGNDESSEKETTKKKRKSREKADFRLKESVHDKRRFQKVYVSYFVCIVDMWIENLLRNDKFVDFLLSGEESSVGYDTCRVPKTLAGYVIFHFFSGSSYIF